MTPNQHNITECCFNITVLNYDFTVICPSDHSAVEVKAQQPVCYFKP